MISRLLLVAAIAVTALALGASTGRAVTLPPGNVAQQWNKIAEDTVVGSGAFQGESFRPRIWRRCMTPRSRRSRTVPPSETG